jgi:hypothetical protein
VRLHPRGSGTTPAKRSSPWTASCPTTPIGRHASFAANLWSLARWSEITAVLGEPEDRSERNVLLLLSRLLSRDETRRLLVMIRRAVRAVGPY